MEIKNKKLVSLDHCKEVVSQLKKNQQTIVFTNGCFDILHAGHVDYLERAKSHGDFLILGLNSDISVKSIKGPSRPVNKEHHRAKVLAGLTAIDYIVFFSEDNPVAIISELKPDIHVKGGDYKKEDLPEYPIVKSYGGDVIIEAFVDGFSTSAIINTLK